MKRRVGDVLRTFDFVPYGGLYCTAAVEGRYKSNEGTLTAQYETLYDRV